MAFAMGFIMFIIIIYIIALILFLLSYIAQGLYYSRLGKRLGMENSSLAWVPFARLYYQGKITERVSANKNMGLKYIISYCGLLFLSFISGIMSAFESSSDGAGIFALLFSIIVLAVAIYVIICQIKILYHGIKQTSPDNATLFTVLGVIFGDFAQIIIFFYLSTKVNKIEDNSDIYQF